MRHRLFFCLALCLCSNSFGFELSGNYWEPAQATFHVGMSGSAPSGTSWNTAFKRAMDNWSAATNFLFLADDSFKNPCDGRNNDGFGDSFSSVNFTPDVCGTAFGASTIAITKTSGPCLTSACNNFRIEQSDILFRSDETWNIYSGPHSNAAIDFERVALHELGHAIGLRHEQSQPAIMQATVANTRTLQIDDIAGANAIYPGDGTETPVTLISSVYGVDIMVPGSSIISGPDTNVSISGNLASSDASLDGKYLDVYQFTFANDSAVSLQLNSSAINPFLYLVRITSTQDGVPAYTFTSETTGSSAAQINELIQAGTYWVGVSSTGSSQQGSYSLSLISASSTPPSSFQSFQSAYGASVQLNSNPSIAGALGNNDFVIDGKRIDLYQFTVINQTNLRIDLSSAAFDTVLLIARLLPGGLPSTQLIDESFIVQNDDFGSGTNSRLQQSLSPGNYWIGVTSAITGQTGDYQIETTLVLP